MKELSDTQLDILLILSDQQGHALHDLETRLNKPKGNLKKYLASLETEEDERSWASLSFGISDIKDPNGLVNKLHEAKDPLSIYIRDQLPDGLRSFIENCNTIITRLDYKSSDLYSLAFNLDLIMKKHHLFDEQRCAHLQLPDETKSELIKQISEGVTPIYPNRLLLEVAYPNEIEKSKISAIYRGNPRKTTRKGSRRPKQLEIPYYINNNLKIFESIVEDFLNRKEYARLFLNRIKRLYDREGHNEVLYKGKNMDFYEGEFDKHEIRLKEFMCSQYTGNLIKKFGFIIIGGFLERDDIEECLEKYSDDNIFEMTIADEAHKKGFINEEERK